MDCGSSRLGLCLPAGHLRRLATDWLSEDCPTLDVGGYIVGDKVAVAQLKCKQPCLLAGRPFFDSIFEALECTVEWRLDEGSEIVEIPRIVADISGPTRNLLLGERPALNLLSRTSGIATLTNEFVKKAAAKGWAGRIAATRKTTPGFRLAEKYAVMVGGGDTHRFDLSASVMLKDNHIDAVNGDIAEAIRSVRKVLSFTGTVEVECRSEADAIAAATSGADIIMLDNFSAEEVGRVSKELKEKWPNVKVESSGGINRENFISHLYKDVDIVSMSCLTQGYPAVDFSMKIVK